MKTKLKPHALFLAVLCALNVAHSQGTAFTYQGRLTDNAASANGPVEFQCTLWNALSGGAQMATATPVTTVVTVTNGLFTLPLDFGTGVFDGADRYLQIEVRTTIGPFTLLTPRQKMTPTPYAIYASTASNVVGGSVVKSLNNLKDGITLAAGSNVTITPSGNTLTIASAGANLWSVNGSNAYYNAGNVGVATTTPKHRLSIGVGPLWTSSGWSGGIALENASAIAWQTNAAGKAFGMGQSSGGLYMFHTVSAPGTTASIAQYDLMISDVGNVGIGTINPIFKLDVAGNGRINNLLVAARPEDTYPFAVWDVGGSDLFAVQASPSPAVASYANFFVTAHAYKSMGGTSWEPYSDRRLKQDVHAYEIGLSEVLQLRAVRFRYRDGLKPGLTSAEEEVGFIAQEVREVIPDAVTEDQDGYLMLKVDPIHWAAINAIQELNEKLEEQRAAKDAEITTLKQRLEKLEQLMNHNNWSAKQ